MFSIRTRRTLRNLLLAILAPTVLGAAAAEFPSQPIRVVVPYAAGGTSDAVARQVVPRMAQAVGQNMLIDNRPGAGGSLGSGQVAKATADGHTILITLSSHTINPGLYPTLPYDTEKDFRTVTLLASGPQILAVGPAVPVKTLKEYLAWVRAKAERGAYASGGQGTPGHLAAELLASMSGVPFQHIPYRGGGAAVSDVIGGQVPAVWVTAIAAIPHIKSGRLKALAVTTAKRVAVLPDVPTVAESGFPGYVVDAWVGLFVPAATPEPIVQRLYGAAQSALAEPEIKASLLAQGLEALGVSPAASQAQVAAELRQWRKLIAERGIKAE